MPCRAGAHRWAGGVAIVDIEASLSSWPQPGGVHVEGHIGDLAPLQAHRQGGLQHVGHLHASTCAEH